MKKILTTTLTLVILFFLPNTLFSESIRKLKLRQDEILFYCPDSSTLNTNLYLGLSDMTVEDEGLIDFYDRIFRKNGELINANRFEKKNGKTHYKGDGNKVKCLILSEASYYKNRNHLIELLAEDYPNLEELHISGNLFWPENIGDFKQIKRLYFHSSFNEIGFDDNPNKQSQLGPYHYNIPKSLYSLVNLEELYLDHSYPLYSKIKKLNKLKKLAYSHLFLSEVLSPLSYSVIRVIFYPYAAYFNLDTLRDIITDEGQYYKCGFNQHKSNSHFLSAYSLFPVRENVIEILDSIKQLKLNSFDIKTHYNISPFTNQNCEKDCQKTLELIGTSKTLKEIKYITSKENKLDILGDDTNFYSKKICTRIISEKYSDNQPDLIYDSTNFSFLTNPNPYDLNVKQVNSECSCYKYKRINKKSFVIEIAFTQYDYTTLKYMYKSILSFDYRNGYLVNKKIKYYNEGTNSWDVQEIKKSEIDKFYLGLIKH